MKQFHIFLAFFRVGMLGYGGGPSAIPLVHKEVVGKYKWMDEDEFSDVLALGNTLPGPIATKMAGYIGHRVAGPLGMINAVLATIVPTILLMILLLSTVSSIKQYEWVQGMTAAVVPVVFVMLSVLTLDFMKKSKESLGLPKAAFLVTASLLIIEAAGLHPALVIAFLLIAALMKKDAPSRSGKDSGERGAS